MKKLKDSLFIKTCTLTMNNPLKFFYMLFFDFLFIISLLVVNAVMNNVIPQDPKIIETLTKTHLLYILSLLPAYLFSIILLYSFFKYCILHIILSLFSERKFDIKMLPKFILINAILFAVFFAVFILLNSFYLFSIKPENLGVVYTITMVPFILLSYTLLNITHSLFIKKYAIKESLMDALSITFKKIPSYFPLILLTIICFVLYYFLYIFFIAHLGMAIGQIVALVIFYLVIAFDRIYFYLISETKNVLP